MYTLQDLKNPEVKKDESVIFKLQSGKFAKNGRYIGPSESYMPTDYVITVPKKLLSSFNPETDDPDDEVEVYCKHFINQPRIVRNSFGQDVLEGTVGDIIFNHGSLSVEARYLSTIKFLKYCPYNADNLLKVKNKIPLFFEFQPEKKLIEKHEKRKRKNDAINLAVDMPYRELEEYAKALGIDTALGEKFVRAAMSEIAENDPDKFITGSKGTDIKFRALINKAISAQIIEYAVNTQDWNRLEVGAFGKTKRNQIVRVPRGEDSMSYFVSFLAGDAGLFAHLETLVKEATGGKKK